ncbi:hypothetical protein QT381_00795 [Galbitalea sp. SE-J8]|uniref:hypothetical protein n=1 Tax=Galbitalea sp. SE-J8 TaxID=3054952 RepID=UPI00259CB14E|nr:hypothetical protein [Galbitalea sp. SE-J8]MDM4761546.1 hypothetical protein [Galbitalea sp. SE-J8]
MAQAVGVEDPRIVHIPTDVIARLSADGAPWCVQNFQYSNVFDTTAAHRDLGFDPTIDWPTGAAGLDTEFVTPVSATVRADLESILARWHAATDELPR